MEDDAIFRDPFFHVDWDQFEELLLRQLRNHDDDDHRAVDMPHAGGTVYRRMTHHVIRRDGSTTTEHREDHSVRHGTGDARVPVVAESRRVRSSYDHVQKRHLQTLAQRLRRVGEWADIHEYVKVGDDPARRRRRGHVPAIGQ